VIHPNSVATIVEEEEPEEAVIYGSKYEYNKNRKRNFTIGKSPTKSKVERILSCCQVNF
jgi:hypothetical protein